MLSKNQLKDIEKLQRYCEKNVPFQLKLNWEMLQGRASDEKHDFFHYVNDDLVGFLGLYGFGSKIEICGMVKPEYRRQGIFTKLFKEALHVINEGNYEEILLNTPASSSSGKAFVMKQSCQYTMTEHQMKHTGQGKQSNEVHKDDKNLVLRGAVAADLDTEVHLDVSCFGFSEDEAKQYNERIKQDPTQQFYMIDYNLMTIGMIRVAHYNNEAWIFGFAISPKHQGQGYGKKTLLKIIKQEQENGYPLFLEVETQNAHALKLYEACGFRSYQSQDYYALIH